MMTNAELIKLTLRDAAAALADGRTTSVALCSAFLERIQAVEPKVRALLALECAKPHGKFLKMYVEAWDAL